MDIKAMMKQIFCVLFCMPFLLSLVSCGDDTQDGGGSSTPPSAALGEAFEADFPGAVDVSWTSYNEYAIVSFNLKTKSTSTSYLAWYTNTNTPELVQQQEKVDAGSGMLPSSLPQAIRDHFNQSIYNNSAQWRVDEVEIHKRYYAQNYNGSQLVYKIELDAIQAGVYDVDLYYDEQGLLLKECVDYDDDRDHDWDDNDVPVSSDKMKEYIAAAQGKYPGYRVDDVERISTRVEGYTTLIMVEMEKEQGGNDEEIEVLLQENASWLATSFEMDYSRLPQEIAAVVSSTYAGWEVDEDAYRWETADATYPVLYSVEMEKEEGNMETEQHVFFSQDGKVVRTLSKVGRD